MRLRYAKTLLTAAAMLSFLPVSAVAQQAAPGAAATVAESPAGLAEWEKIAAVLAHPRCTGCHVSDDRPRWSGDHYGGTKVHAFNVRRGTDGSGFGNVGMRCATCHSTNNSNVLHGPPGAENWHLAPAEMAWFGQSSAAICEQIKDPSRNGGRALEAIALHVRDDKLVAWGWNPGAGREPAPGSAEETYRALERWAAQGAPCPK